MPIGSSSVYRRLVHLLELRRPRSVLDLGVGLGINGAAVRNWLDYGVTPYPTLLVGVEGHAAYRNPMWLLYSDIEIGDIATAAALDRPWACILMTDVLEHFDRLTGEHVLGRIAAALEPGGLAIVTTPAIWFAQGAWGDNPLETHRCLWTADELRALGWSVDWDGTPDEYGQSMLLATWERPVT
jgi:2-polyprenyl-3-methyl-5-hydroxy-6-metoxy-1,4-benzoquinol methylase